MPLTKPQRARLEKLAAYLEGLPEDYQHFGMSTFFEEKFGSNDLRKYALHNGGVASCGTSACAVGHGPAAGVLVPARFAAEQSSWRMWMLYSALFVGKRETTNDFFEGFPDQRPFEWLFGEDWNMVDDGHRGAAARIRYYLAKGIPSGFDQQGSPGWRDFVQAYAPYRIDAKAKAS